MTLIVMQVLVKWGRPIVIIVVNSGSGDDNMVGMTVKVGGRYMTMVTI